MTAATLVPALIALLMLFLAPRLAQGPRSLASMAAAGALLIAGLWSMRGPPETPGDMLWMLALFCGAGGFAAGVAVRAIVLAGRARGWPPVADAVFSLMGGGFLFYAVLRLLGG